MQDFVDILIIHPAGISDTLMSTPVAPDCGLLHLSVAVGTPVVGLYGATSSHNRGPCGYADLVIDRNDRCQCEGFHSCYNAGIAGPGDCMHKIMLEEVVAKLKVAINYDSKEHQHYEEF